MKRRSNYRPRQMGKSLALARAQADAACTGQPAPASAAKPPAHEEDDEQKTLFQEWVPLHLTRFPELKLLHAVPNGGTRKAFEAKRLVLQGTKAGVPDLDLPVPRIGRLPLPGAEWKVHFIGLRIEMKKRWAKGVPGARKPATSPEQRQWLSDLQDAGHCCCVCYGWAQAAESILAYLTGQPVPHQWSRK